MSNHLATPEIVAVIVNPAEAADLYQQVADGTLVAHEVAYDESSFGTVFVESQPVPEREESVTHGRVATALRKVVGIEKPIVALDNPNIATDDQKDRYTELFRDLLPDYLKDSAVHYLQQMRPTDARRFAMQLGRSAI